MANSVPNLARPISSGMASHHDAASFRPDIEGLRAICVGAVVAFHAFPSALSGGFIGVDVFFVISGFLITQLLLREIEATGRVDLLDFWARRIRRILPAATLVLCATACLALFVAAVDTRLLGRHVIAAALFYYNWRQAGQAVDYLAQDDRDNPLLHYWSLAVEEQFYLVWPVVLSGLAVWLGGHVGAKRPGHLTTIGAAIGVLGLSSFGLCIYLTEASAAEAFFNTFVRAWQLLAGAAVAVLVMLGSRPGKVFAGGLGIAALGTLFASCVLISEKVAYPGFASLAPTLSAAAVIYAGTTSGTLTANFLSLAPLRYIGRISFSWYLWHWPLIVLASLVHNELGGHFSAGPVAWSAIVVSFLLAALTFRYVEQPARHSPVLNASKRKTFILGAGLIAAGVGTGFALKSFGPDEVPIGNGKFMSRTAMKQDRPIIYSDRCLLRFVDVNYAPCVYGDANGSKSVVLFGDSHAGNWFSALDVAAKKLGWRLVVRIKASCRPIDAPHFHDNGQEYRECKVWRDRVLVELAEIDPTLIVVSALSNTLPAEAELSVIRSLAEIAPTIVMRDTPKLPETPSDCLKRTGSPEKCSWELEQLMYSKAYPKTDASELPTGASILDLNSRICPDGRCRAITNGRVLMSDRHHLSDSYSKTLAGAFERVLREHSK